MGKRDRFKKHLVQIKLDWNIKEKALILVPVAIMLWLLHPEYKMFKELLCGRPWLKCQKPGRSGTRCYPGEFLLALPLLALTSGYSEFIHG